MSRTGTSSAHRAGQAGFTLIELLVVVAIISIVMITWIQSMTNRPLGLASTILQFEAMLLETRARAAVIGDDPTGATLYVSRRNGLTYVFPLDHRPVQQAIVNGGPAPKQQSDVPPLITQVQISIIPMPGSASLPPPFGVFIGSSGRTSAAYYDPTSTDYSAFAVEPLCGTSRDPVMQVTFSFGAQQMTRFISCASAAMLSEHA